MKAGRTLPFHCPTFCCYRLRLLVKKILLTQVLNLQFRIKKIPPLKVTINLKRQVANNTRRPPLNFAQITSTSSWSLVLASTSFSCEQGCCDFFFSLPSNKKVKQRGILKVKVVV